MPKLIPPLNFSLVEPLIHKDKGALYRSAFPVDLNYSFLKTLSLQSIICLNPELLEECNLESFCKEEGIILHSVDIGENREPFTEMDHVEVGKAVSISMDPAKRPLLVMCEKGKHRTGVVISCIRKVHGNWSLTASIDEFAKFLGDSKITPLSDIQFIESFEREPVANNPAKEGGEDAVTTASTN